MKKDSKQALAKAAGTQVGTGCGCWDGPVESLLRGGDILALGQRGVDAQPWETQEQLPRTAVPSLLNCVSEETLEYQSWGGWQHRGAQRTGRTRQALPVTSCVASGKPCAAHRQLSQVAFPGHRLAPITAVCERDQALISQHSLWSPGVLRANGMWKKHV